MATLTGAAILSPQQCSKLCCHKQFPSVTAQQLAAAYSQLCLYRTPVPFETHAMTQSQLAE
jgi:hypothetical protein